MELAVAGFPAGNMRKAPKVEFHALSIIEEPHNLGVVLASIWVAPCKYGWVQNNRGFLNIGGFPFSSNPIRSGVPIFPLSVALNITF